MRNTLNSVLRVLKKNKGQIKDNNSTMEDQMHFKKFISIGFQQPHFRKRYLINEDVRYGWEDHIETDPINVGLGYFYTVCIPR